MVDTTLPVNTAFFEKLVSFVQTNPAMVLLAIGAFAVFAIYYLSFSGAIRKHSSIKSRVNLLVQENKLADDGQLLSLDEKRAPLAVSLESILRLFGVDVNFHRINMQPRLAQAGIADPDMAVYYVFYKRFVTLFFIALGIFIALQPAATTLLKLLNLLGGGLIIILGYFGFDIWLKNTTDKRQHRLTRSFPDALDLLLVCVESGLALDGALSRVCKELGTAYPEITYELNRTRMELALLNDRTQALNNLAVRTGLQPFRSLVATLIQTEKFGTSLTDTLRVLSDDYRQTRLMVAENKAGRLPALMTIPLICLMMPAFVMVILGPPFIKLFGAGGVLDK